MATMGAKELGSKGGRARAESLSPERKAEIARQAADARWNVPKATHAGEFNIGDITLACAVLEDGRRLLDYGTFTRVMGRTGKPKRAEIPGEYSSYRGDGKPPENKGETPFFLSAENLKPFIGTGLRSPTSSVTVVYRTLAGRKAFGYEAVLLPWACDVYRAADRAGVLTAQQKLIATTCDIILPALAAVGITALVDEATGYKDVRNKRALQAIMDRYLRPEFADWARCFPPEFYKEMFRLKGWPWNPQNPAGGPRVIAHYTKDVIYVRLAPELLKELETRNPMQTNGRRLARHHQWMTEDIGHVALNNHFAAVLGLMRACGNWEMFTELMDRAFPKKGVGYQLTFEDMLPDGGVE